MVTTFKDSTSDKFSAKRLFTLLLIIILAVVIFAHTFFGMPLEEYILTGLADIIIWSMAFIGSEKLVGNMMANGRFNTSIRGKKSNGDE